jgi:hypothetical protein
LTSEAEASRIPKTTAIFDDTSFDEEWADEIEEEYVNKHALKQRLSLKMVKTISDMESGTEEKKMVDIGAIDPNFEEQPVYDGD